MKFAMVKLISQVQKESETISAASGSVNECVAKLNDDIATMSAAAQEFGSFFTVNKTDKMYFTFVKKVCNRHYTCHAPSKAI